MANSSQSIAEVVRRLRIFTAERDWEQFHTPRNLATALAVEAAELLELFQWDVAQVNPSEISTELRRRFEEEIADVLIYSLLFADTLGINPAEAIIQKVEHNALKYPVHLSKGSSMKYSDRGGDL